MSLFPKRMVLLDLLTVGSNNSGVGELLKLSGGCKTHIRKPTHPDTRAVLVGTLSYQNKGIDVLISVQELCSFGTILTKRKFCPCGGAAASCFVSHFLHTSVHIQCRLGLHFNCTAIYWTVILEFFEITEKGLRKIFSLESIQCFDVVLK